MTTLPYSLGFLSLDLGHAGTGSTGGTRPGAKVDGSAGGQG